MIRLQASASLEILGATQESRQCEGTDALFTSTTSTCRVCPGAITVMVRKEEIIEGCYLRTCSNSLRVPTGTLARVETVGTTWQGEFVFTVRWLNWRAETQARSVSDRSLNLWEQDLAHFEAVSREEAAAGNTAPIQLICPKLTVRVGGHRRQSKSKTANIGQLSLFTSEDF